MIGLVFGNAIVAVGVLIVVVDDVPVGVIGRVCTLLSHDHFSSTCLSVSHWLKRSFFSLPKSVCQGLLQLYCTTVQPADIDQARKKRTKVLLLKEGGGLFDATKSIFESLLFYHLAFLWPLCLSHNFLAFSNRQSLAFTYKTTHVNRLGRKKYPYWHFQVEKTLFIQTNNMERAKYFAVKTSLYCFLIY